MRSVLVCLLVAAAASACVERPEPDASGEEVYLQTCAQCHGADLEGGAGPALGATSPAAEQPDEFLRMTITDGRGRMPSFRRSLSPDLIERVIDHLRERQAAG